MSCGYYGKLIFHAEKVVSLASVWTFWADFKCFSDFWIVVELDFFADSHHIHEVFRNLPAIVSSETRIYFIYILWLNGMFFNQNAGGPFALKAIINRRRCKMYWLTKHE